MFRITEFDFFETMKMNDIFPKRLTFGICTLAALMVASPAEASLFKKKKKVEKTETVSPYKKLTGRDSVEIQGIMNVIEKGDSVLLELPVNLLGRAFLVHNKLQQVPAELNDANATKGVNYENQMVRFEWDKPHKNIIIRQQRVTPDVKSGSLMARSVTDNYIDPVIAIIKVSLVAPDSSTVIFNVSDLFNGRKNILNDVFNVLNLEHQI